MIMNFKEKVQSMTGKEIVLTMVKGLQNPKLKIDMGSYGHQDNGICYGCAATNTICKISGKAFNQKNINSRIDRASFIDTDLDFLYDFETAIDFLREGNIKSYNKYAEKGEFSTLTRLFKLPELTDNYTPEDLQAYTDYANTL